MTARNLRSADMTGTNSQKAQSISRAHDKEVNPGPKHWYSIPEPIRRVFDRFPLVTYKENSIPQRARQKTSEHTLYIFRNTFDISGTLLSCNPTCLKWQVYLKLNGIEFAVAGSNNHASPSGSLPFLLPASSKLDPLPLPLSTGKLPRWISQQAMQEVETLSIQHEAYMALIDHSIRNAWLYHLYLVKANFVSVAYPLYVSTTSSNQFVQKAIAYQLREAARNELLKSMHIVDGDEVYLAAAESFQALSTLLDSRNFYSGTDSPGLFDASVFAYTHLVLDTTLPWQDTRLCEILQNNPRLIQHRDRLMALYNEP